MNKSSLKSSISQDPNLHILEKLGQGSYGSVYKVLDHSNKNFYAVKFLTYKEPSQGISIDALREIRALKRSSSPNVIKLHKVERYLEGLVLFLEYCDMDLMSFIKLKGEDELIYTSKNIKWIILQILSGVQHLHSIGIIHRDLKPLNILINLKDLSVKIGDFGLSRILDFNSRKLTKEICTLRYRAPELLLGCQQYHWSIDSWSIGCILAELLMRKCCFEGNDDLELLDSIFKVFGTFNDDMLPGLMLFPKYNPTFKKHKGIGLIEHVRNQCQFKDIDDKCFDLLSKMLIIDPTKRITPLEALNHVSFIYFKE